MKGKDRIAEAKRLRKSDLKRYQRLWRAAVRETIKRLPCPPAFPDIVSLFDAALDEIQGGRDIAIAVGAAKPRKGAA
jgi:hypothetical protein